MVSRSVCRKVVQSVHLSHLSQWITKKYIDLEVSASVSRLVFRDFSVYFNLGPGSGGIGKFASF